MKILKSLLIILFVSAFFISCAQTENKNPVNKTNKPVNEKPKPESTPDEMAKGRKLYKEQCARCHQENGTGGRVEIEGKTLSVDDLTSEKMINEPDEEYVKYMIEGIEEEGMPSFKDVITKDEMNEIVKFIRKEIQKKK